MSDSKADDKQTGAAAFAAEVPGLQQSLAILDSVFDGVVLIDADGMIRDVNHAVCKMLGYSRQQLLNQSVNLLMLDPHRSRHDHYLADYLLSGESDVIGRIREFAVCRRNGDVFPAEFVISELKQDGQRYFIAVMRDISERKSAVEALNLMARFPAENPNPVMRFDRHGQLIYSNAPSQPLLELWLSDTHRLPDDIVERIASLLDEDDLSPVTGSDNRCIVHEQVFAERIYQFLFCAIADAGYVNVYGTDVTARRQAEDAVREYQEHLEELVHERTLGLELAIREAHVANEAKSHFLANMSHELRTPLNAIIGYSEMLREGFTSMPAEEVRADLDNILQSGRYLLELVNDVLDLSKIEAGKMQIKPRLVDVPVLVNDIAYAVRLLMQKNHNQFTVYVADEVDMVMADEIRLRQVLLNVLSNAAKFTRSGQVSLEVCRNGARVDFMITDTGIGMKEEQMGRLFQPFSQGDVEISRYYGGTGLGLVISKRLCNLMGGDIRVSSEPGVGSVFSISMPVGQPQ